MPTLSPLFLEQEIFLTFTNYGFYGYTRKPELGVAFLDIEIDIEADTLDRWEIAALRAVKANSTPVKTEYQPVPFRLFADLRSFLMREFHDELQSHVDVNMMPASLAENSDRVYDERHS